MTITSIAHEVGLLPRRARLTIARTPAAVICRTTDRPYVLPAAQVIRASDMDRLVAWWLDETIVRPYHAKRGLEPLTVSHDGGRTWAPLDVEDGAVA